MAQACTPSSVRAGEEGIPSACLSASEKQCNVEAFVDQRERLRTAIDSTQSLLDELRRFNKEEWIVRYPRLDATASSSAKLRRALSFADSPNSRSEVVLTPKRKGLARSITLASLADIQEDGTVKDAPIDESETLIPNDDFHILRLDLKIGPYGASTSPAALVSQLEKSSIANLLDERMGASASHIDKLRLRVEDTSSKVLVTGDLNAGKSTFVNALLRREVMPVDQQPCTTAFCEIHDAAENQGKEEVHILKEDVTYSIQDESTYKRGSIEDLEEIFIEHENNSRQVIKIYLSDSRAPSQSLLNNGVVDISLIDAPGLNRDSIKTTAVFARQEEIDVVVFVVSAENHFTLSAKEFLINASKEKAYLFIVVNKYEQIKNKAKCQQLVYEQIKQLSPETYQDRDELVHFVDSAAALQPFIANPTFDDLEDALRSFVLAKRSKSKLQPASTYLKKLLADMELLAGANAIVADRELEVARADLDRVKPVLAQMVNAKEALEEALVAIEEDGTTVTSKLTKAILQQALERVGQGSLGVDSPVVKMPSYPGLLGVWDYAKDVRRALLASLDAAVRAAEDEARLTTVVCVKKIGDLAEASLPVSVERNKRVFIPEAMFNVRKGNRKGKREVVVAGGMAGLGIGLVQRSDLSETTFSDICDMQHHVWVHFGDGRSGNEDEESIVPSALSVVSVAAGALTMVGGQAIGLRKLVEGAVWVSGVMNNESSRKWVAPVLGASVLGISAYLVLDLPNSIPRNVGRRIKRRITLDGERHGAWVDDSAVKVTRETRKVLRIAGYDLRKRFRDALDDRAKEVNRSEEMEKKAGRAKEWFEGLMERTGQVSAGLA